jgi:hypothetical protein
MSEQQDGFDSWAILELLGHVRLAGRVTEEERFGTKLGRIDIPLGEQMVTQYFSAASIYRLTPTTEEIARAVALRNQPEPVHRWELPAPPAAAAAAIHDGDDVDLDGPPPSYGRGKDDDYDF